MTPRTRSFSLLLALCISACSQAKRAPVPTDCSVLDAYELHPNGSFNGTWFASADATHLPDGGVSTASANSEMIDPPLCGLTQALVFASSGSHDWGSLAGNYVVPNFGSTPESDKNASGYEGLSFWARSLYDRSLALSLGDDTVVELPENAASCEPQYLDDAGTLNPAFYFPPESGLPAADGCGNSFVTQLLTSDRWEFYTIPFTAFTQIAQDPRVRPNGINRAAVLAISMRAPKDSIVETWFANFAWYRAKAP